MSPDTIVLFSHYIYNKDIILNINIQFSDSPRLGEVGYVECLGKTVKTKRILQNKKQSKYKRIILDII